MSQEVSFLRHAGWVGPEDLTDTVNIIGCGATGSHIALAAAKMGYHSFRLWDADVVEPHNLANQAYDIEHLDQPKVEALAHVLKRFNPGVRVEVHNKFFTTEEDQQNLKGILILTTDSMSSRKDIYNSFFTNTEVEAVFETRLGFDYGELHIIDNLQAADCIAWYDTLVDDDQVEPGPCNLRICTTLVQLVSSYTVHMICARAAALRQRERWEYPKKTQISLLDSLRVMSIK